MLWKKLDAAYFSGLPPVSSTTVDSRSNFPRAPRSKNGLVAFQTLRGCWGRVSGLLCLVPTFVAGEVVWCDG